MAGKDKEPGGRRSEEAEGRRKGAAGMEFGVLVGLVAVVAVAATATVGGKVREIFGGTANAVQLGMNGTLGSGASLNLAGGVTAPTAPTINTSALAGGILSTAYSQTLSASGQNGDGVSWSLASGATPSGLSLNGTSGVISGTPSSMGTAAFSVRATDVVNGLSSTASFSISIGGTAPTISTASLPGYVLGGGAYSQTLAGTTTPSGDGITWSTSGGPLPPGLVLTPASGVIAGTPTTAGTYGFNAVATDLTNGLSSSVALTLAVAADPCPGYHVSGQNRCDFTYIGSNQSFTVPAGTSQVHVYLWGAGGGGWFATGYPYMSNASRGGGNGGYVDGTLAVSAGETLAIVVGQGGGANNAGSVPLAAFGGGGAPDNGGLGSGGGRSAVRRGASDVAAAGGGGSGNYSTYYSLGRGGSGGWPNGEDGSSFTNNGTGGTQSAGGTYGASQYQGGSANTSGIGNAGGGGGWYGGGAGFGGSFWGAGGGGSSYVGGLTSSTTAQTTGPANGTVPSTMDVPMKTSPYYSGRVAAGGENHNDGQVANTTGGNRKVVVTW